MMQVSLEACSLNSVTDRHNKGCGIIEPIIKKTCEDRNVWQITASHPTLLEALAAVCTRCPLGLSCPFPTSSWIKENTEPESVRWRWVRYLQGSEKGTAGARRQSRSEVTRYLKQRSLEWAHKAGPWRGAVNGINSPREAVMGDLEDPGEAERTPVLGPCSLVRLPFLHLMRSRYTFRGNTLLFQLACEVFLFMYLKNTWLRDPWLKERVRVPSRLTM